MRLAVIIALHALIFPNQNLIAQSIEDSKVYYEFRNEDVQISLKSGQLVIEHSVHEKKNYNVDANPSMTVEYIFDRSFSEISKIDADYGLPHGKNGKCTKYTTSNILKQSDFSRGIFYDDNTYYEVNYPRVLAGGYTELQYEIELNDPHFMKGFYFSDVYGVKESSYTITVDPDINITWSIFGEQKDQIEFTEEILKKGKKRYSWRLKNIDPYYEEKNSPGYYYSGTFIVVRITDYSFEGKTISVLNSVEDLFVWYQSFLEQIVATEDSTLEEITREVVKGAQDDYEKAKRIFHWVQDNIRYIAFEDGWRGFIPYPAQQVCDKRYGDCKDMSNLLYCMLEIGGVQSNLAWVGTRDIPFRYEELPDPLIDNHMIVYTEIGDSTIFMDATNSYSPFGLPTSFILSKEVLTTDMDGGMRILTVPEYNAEDCVINDSISLEIEGNSIFGSASKQIESFEYGDFQNYYSASITNTEGFLEKYLKLGLQKFELINCKIIYVNERSKIKIMYDFKMEKSVIDYEGSQFINLNFTRPFSNQILADDRKQFFEIPFKRKYETQIILKIPENAEIAVLPDDIDAKFNVGSVKAKYTRRADSIIYERIITVDRLIIEPEIFAEWNSFIEEILKVYNNGIEFKKKL
jgi:hypothetical protein